MADDQLEFKIVRTGRAAAQYERMSAAEIAAYRTCEHELASDPWDPRFTSDISSLDAFAEGDRAAVFDDFTFIYRIVEESLIEITYIDRFLAEYDAG